MSLSDKVIGEIRDDTFAGGLVDDDETGAFGDEFTNLIDSADQPFGPQRLLALAAVAEVLTLTVVMFGMSYLRPFANMTYFPILGVVFVFLIGFFAAFAVCKLYGQYAARDREVHVDDDVMFRDKEPSQSDLSLYLISVAGGIANFFLIIALLTIKIS
jgi:hypothetical protein